MGSHQKTLFNLFLIAGILLLAGCQAQTKNYGNGVSTGSTTPSSGSTTTTTTTSSQSGPKGFQIIFASGTSSSFDNTTPPTSGGVYVPVSRFYDLSGSLIPSSQYSQWWVDTSSSGSGAFLTSTSTTFPGGGSSATTSSSTLRYQTPCAYFDNSNDNNPETGGYYTIDGIVPNPVSLSDTIAASDVDQCAGISASEKSKLGFFIKLRRAYMDSTDKLQIIVKARPLNQPNMAPVPSSCVVGGLFDATSCATSVFTVTMRSSPTAAARPFMMLFPSAKSLDLISESVLLPWHLDSTMTTISLDRIKGGLILYNVTLVRIP